MSQSEFIQILLEKQLLRNDVELREFIDALDKLIALPDVHFTSDLFRIFTDEAINTPPLQTLLAFIDSFDKEVVIPLLMEVTPELSKTAFEWLSTIYTGILGRPESRENLVRISSSSDPLQKHSIRKILEHIRTRDIGDEEVELEIREEVDSIIENF